MFGPRHQMLKLANRAGKSRDCRARSFGRSRRRFCTSSSFTPLSHMEESLHHGADTRFSKHLKILDPKSDVKSMDTYRVIDEHGQLLDEDYDLQVSQDRLLEMYRTRVRLNTVDDIYYDSQRQGRISFYMTNTGEEGCAVGSAEPLSQEDVIYTQYREAGVLLWRGFTLQEMADQCFSNVDDLGKGRQMPIHYGSKKLNVQTLSSPLSTQICQAAGAAYALKREKKEAVSVCYFGDGAASEGDLHAGMNFAATLNCPTIFFCRNNQFAISTHVNDQYSKNADGIVGRAAGYGMLGVRVDGNDLIAVNEVTRAAREMVVKEKRPILIEAMTYRAGHHSTSDDASRYRDESEHYEKVDNPIIRCRLFLEKNGWWDAEKEKDLREETRKEVLRTFRIAEQKLKPPVEDLFNDVYDELTPELKKQRDDLQKHLAKHPE
eukprot:9829_1